MITEEKVEGDIRMKRAIFRKIVKMFKSKPTKKAAIAKTVRIEERTLVEAVREALDKIDKKGF